MDSAKVLDLLQILYLSVSYIYATVRLSVCHSPAICMPRVCNGPAICMQRPGYLYATARRPVPDFGILKAKICAL